MRRNFGRRVTESGSIERDGPSGPNWQERLTVAPPALLPGKAINPNRHNVTRPENIGDSVTLKT